MGDARPDVALMPAPCPSSLPHALPPHSVSWTPSHSAASPLPKLVLCLPLIQLCPERAAATSAMAELWPPRDSLSPASLHPNRTRHRVPHTTPPLWSSSPHRLRPCSEPPPEHPPASRPLPWPHHHGLPLAAPSPSSDAPESELAPLPPLTAGDLLAGDW
jgi:hypothetical protein